MITFELPTTFVGDTAASRGAKGKEHVTPFDRAIRDNALTMIDGGRHIFRFDTFGDEEFWGDTLNLAPMGSPGRPSSRPPSDWPA